MPQTFTIKENSSKKVTLGGHHWDGVVGLMGVKTINDKWYFDYYGDVGAGDSKLTWVLPENYVEHVRSTGLKYQTQGFAHHAH